MSVVKIDHQLFLDHRAVGGGAEEDPLPDEFLFEVAQLGVVLWRALVGVEDDRGLHAQVHFSEEETPVGSPGVNMLVPLRGRIGVGGGNIEEVAAHVQGPGFEGSAGAFQVEPRSGSGLAVTALAFFLEDLVHANRRGLGGKEEGCVQEEEKR
ncbi:MAG: hypothetical protein IPG32_03500 [Saprospirales bacterium]|nr:hypothetical protein [Saprospirales bacterium]